MIYVGIARAAAVDGQTPFGVPKGIGREAIVNSINQGESDIWVAIASGELHFPLDALIDAEYIS